MEESAEQIPVTDAKQAAAFEHWFTLNEERRQGRQGRIGKAEGLVPPVIWLILIIGAVVVIASVALFADREEAAVTQAAMVAAVAIIVVSGLVLVRFLDKPYEDRNGSIKPRAMERTLAQMEREHRGQAVIRCADLGGCGRTRHEQLSHAGLTTVLTPNSRLFCLRTPTGATTTPSQNPDRFPRCLARRPQPNHRGGPRGQTHSFRPPKRPFERGNARRADGCAG